MSELTKLYKPESSLVAICSVDSQRMIEVVGEPQLRVTLPHCCLYGIQPAEEYERWKEKRAKKLLKEKGTALFEEFPIACCAIPVDESLVNQDIQLGVPYFIVIFDGHHRVRYAPIFKIRDYPSMVFSVGQAAIAMEMDNPDPYDCCNRLINGMTETLNSFSRRIPHLMIPPNVAFEMNGNGPKAVLLR